MARAVTIERSATKQAKCERCGCDYEYDVSRKATRTPTSGALAGGMAGGLAGVLAGAAIDAVTGHDGEAEARGKAQQEAYRRLKVAVEPVPCPDCGWYQTDMVKEARKRARRSKGMFALGSVATVGAFAALVLAQVNNASYGGQPVPWSVVWAVGTVGVVAAVAFVARWVMFGSFDINQGYPAQRAPYPGAPAARRPAPTPDEQVEAAWPSEWYFSRAGAQSGPVTWIELRRMADAGQISASDLVYGPGFDQWYAAADVQDLLPASTENET